MNPNHFFVKKLTQLDALGDTVLTWFTFIVDNVDNTDTSGIVVIFALFTIPDTNLIVTDSKLIHISESITQVTNRICG